MAPAGAKKAEEKGTAEVVADLWQLVKDYAKQETVDPLKSIGKFLGFGLGGALLAGLGVLFGGRATLRARRAAPGAHPTGSLSWVPYLVAFVVTAVIVAVSVRAITKPNRTDGARP